MSDNTEQNLLNAVDRCIDYGTSAHDLNQVSHYLNMQAAITLRIRQNFYSLLSNTDYIKIRKTIELLEYLTINSPAKLKQIINDEKIMEYIGQALMESYLEDQVGNLLRLWIDEFSDSKAELNFVFALIENLETFEIKLPVTYHSKYKTSASNMENDHVQANRESGADSGLKAKLDELIKEAKKFKKDTKKLLDNNDNMGPASRKMKVKTLLAKGSTLCSDFEELQVPDSDLETKQSVEENIEEIKEYRSKLQKTSKQLEKGSPASNRHQSPQAPQEVNHNDHYKIVISELDDFGDKESDPVSNKSHSKTIMTIDELLSYKAQPCPRGVLCQFSPPLHGQSPGKSSYTIEMHCRYWHNHLDKRRPVYGDNGRTLYHYTFCDNVDDTKDCWSGAACSFSHTFYEAHYHPVNYKKKKCKFAKGCKNGKYCPYFHSVEEKKAWKELAEPFFDFPLNDNESRNEINPFQSISTWKNADEEEEDFNPTEEPEYDGLNTLNRHVIHRPKINTPARGLYGDFRSTLNLQYAGNRYNESSSILSKISGEKQISEEKSKGTLHTKLIIRKKYEDPKMLTSFFQKSQIFNGFPFLTQSVDQVEGKEEGQNIVDSQ